MERTGSSLSWFDGDFDADEDEDAFLLALPPKKEPPIVKRRSTLSKKNPSLVWSGKRRKVEEDARSWCDRYAPTTTNDLAVQPKKVQEIRSWITRALSSSNQRNVLALTGPSGSGKTATVKTLARELNCHFRIWEEKETLESKIQSFISFIRQASKYASLCEEKRRQSLLVLEEWPSSINKEEVKDTLIRLGGFYSPLILILNDEGKEQDLLEALMADKIALNPITNTNMIKVLKRMATSENTSGVRSFSIPDQASFMSLSEACKGDIRAAIHSLQFACSNPDKKSSNIKSRKKTSRSANEIKDPSLDLFHALGKVLYAKRTEEKEPFPIPHPSLQRNTLKSDPQDILDFAPMSHEGLTTFLHQNYMDFFQDIGELSSASEYLSLSDEFFVWNLDALSSKVQLSEFGGHLSVRGLLFHNQKKCKSFGGLKTFSKPQIYEVNKNCRSRGSKARSQFVPRSLTSKELFTNFLPLLTKLSSCSWGFGGVAFAKHENEVGEDPTETLEDQSNDEDDFKIEDFD